MLGYSDKKIRAKAEKRGVEQHEYELYLIEKHRTRGERKRKARAEREAAKAQAVKA
jgi:hypothetical protein